MTTLFVNATIVTVDAERRVLHDSALAVDGDRITAIDETAVVQKAHPQAVRVDLRGKVLLPGLVNCHAHLTLTVNRGITEDLSYPPRIRQPTYVRDSLSADDTTALALLGALEALKGGTTTVVENAQGIGRYAAALVGTGLRWVFAEHSRDAVTPAGWRTGEAVVEFSASAREVALQRMHDLFSRWHGQGGGRVTCFPAARLTEASSPELLHAVRELAERHDVGYTIHLSQSAQEVETMLQAQGMRPAVYLDAHGFLGPRLIAAHCRFVDDAEIELLGRSGVIVTHQPGTSGKHGVVPPIAALQDAGCPVVLGTDNNTQDMWEVMRIGLIMERLLRDGSNPAPDHLLAQATVGGASALGLGAEVGSLEVGKKADLVVVDTRKAHLVPATSAVSNLEHYAQAGDVESVMVDGEFAMRDGRVLTIDEAAVVAEADLIGQRVWHEILARYPDEQLARRIAPSPGKRRP
jgi:cytosine/adenosine deaminase-related metal-dependent hydrolase